MFGAHSSVLITGASGGIGSALARALATLQPTRMVLVGRRVEALTALAAELACPTEICVADIGLASGRSRVLSQLKGVDLLVNCAGFGSFGPFNQADADTQQQMVEVNCVAPVVFTRAVLPFMKEQGHGCIVNIASGMGFQPMPYMSTYAASKAFLLHWSEGIAEEVRNSGVRVVTVCPGTVHTGFAQAGAIPLAHMTGVPFLTVSLDAVVDGTMAALQKGHTVTRPGLGNWLATAFGRLVPRAVVRRVLGWVMRRDYRRISG